MIEEFLTKKELAGLLKLSTRTIDRLREKGLPIRKVGRAVRFEKNEVLEWYKKNSQNN